MPFVWTLPPIPRSPQGVQGEYVVDRLTIRAGHQVMSREDLRLEFDQGVVAKYGVTTVQSDKLVVYMAGSAIASGRFRRAIATGHVALIDPDGTIQAERLEFDWETGRGLASNATIEFAGMTLTARSLDIKPGEWLLKDVEGKSCDNGEVQFNLAQLRILPSDRAIGRRLSVQVFGARLPPLPSYTFLIGDSEDVIVTPKVGYSLEKGLRVRWKLSYRALPQTLATGQIAVAEEREPRYELQVVQSFLQPSEPLRAPLSGRSRRLPHSFMTNLKVLQPQDQVDEVSSRRLSLALGSSWNLDPFETETNDIENATEIVVESASSLGKWGYWGQARLERISPKSEADTNRIVGVGALVTPVGSVAPGVELFGRIDFRSHWPKGSAYHGWIRIEPSVSWKASESLRLSASYAIGSTKGAKRFDFDQPYSLNSFGLRMDAKLGPTRIALASRFGGDGPGWHSSEFYVSQLAGCFEPYALYQSNGRNLTIGVRFRPLEKAKEAAQRISERGRGAEPKATP